jgi:HSP20 family protein
MVETERGYDIRVELPGVSRDDIKILIEQNILTISGEKKRNDAEGAHLHRAERIFGKFERSFRLPGNTDGEKVAASYDNGVLIIFLPRAQDLQNREIKIQSADGRNGDVAEIRTSVQ